MAVDQEKKMTNCPKCGKPILNEGIFTSPAKFKMRCPWCYSTLEINIQPKILTEVVKIGNGNGGGHAEGEIQPEPVGNILLRDRKSPPGMKLVGYLYLDEKTD